MATVRITNDIRQQVRSKLQGMYNTRIRKKTEELEHIGAAEACYRKHIPERYRSLAAQLNGDPDGQWVDEQRSIHITIYYPNPDNLEADKVRDSFSAPFATPVPMPQRLRFHNFELTEDLAPYEHAKRILIERRNLTKECDRVVTSIVDEVLGKCTTLRQVLKLWPTALDFMPDHVRAKHAEKTERRSKKAVEELEIDSDVKVSLMKARMLNVNQ